MQKRNLSVILALSLIVLLFQTAIAQKQLEIGTDIPLQYSLGYKYSPDYGIGGGLKVGILTEPHNRMILSTMELFGANEEILDIIREGFKVGLVLDASASWHWNKNYVGANLVFINMNDGEVPLQVIDKHYNFNLPAYWDPQSTEYTQNSMQINLQSNLLQLGVHLGRRIPLKDKFELQIELGLTTNIGSTNIFTSHYPYPQTIYNTMDRDIQDTYMKYAIIPTLGIYLVYNI